MQIEHLFSYSTLITVIILGVIASLVNWSKKTKFTELGVYILYIYLFGITQVIGTGLFYLFNLFLWVPVDTVDLDLYSAFQIWFMNLEWGLLILFIFIGLIILLKMVKNLGKLIFDMHLINIAQQP